MTTIGEMRDIGRRAGRPGILRRALRRAARWPAALLERHRAWRRKRRTIVHLADLADWQLEDIGLTRAEVEEALAEAGVRRDPVRLFERG